MKIQTRDEQRRKLAAKQVLFVQLSCHLDNLAREILAGDVSKLADFQHAVQYAPPEMKSRLLEKIDARL